ncbi:MAG TPA: ectoine/hydroxyectoine ABC transporter permease subunit EhuC [Bauldia sp.]|nr:ectoine/hydroxyectoine ABC transporter permease subunit EhuC [Bauldia sp.]
MDVEILPRLASGTALTIQIAVLSMVLATAISLVLGLLRLVRFLPVRWLVRGWVEFFRGTSVLVQLFWMYYVLPHFGIFLEPFTVGVLGISMNLGAYGAEAVRGAILAVPRTQYEASTALNLSPAHRMRRIILPQALVMLIPPWGNMLIETLKASAVVSLITISDLTFEAYQLNALTFRTLEIFGLTLLIYFILAQIVAAFVRVIERKVKRGLARGTV